MKNIRKIIAFLMAAVLCCLCAFAAATQEFDDHVMLQSMKEGSCQTLTGNVRLIVFAVDTPQAKAADVFTDLEQMVARACDRLKQEALSYGVEITVTPTFYTVSAEAPEQVTSEWVKTVSAQVKDLSKYGRFSWSNAPLVIFIPEYGRAYAQQQNKLDTEFVVIFDGDAEIDLCHEVLHLYGAEDFYVHDDIRVKAQEVFPESIMLNTRDGCSVDSLTAYLVGWQKEMDTQTADFLSATAHITLRDLYDALDAELFTGYGTDVADNGVYTGDMVDGCYHGEGTFVWNEGNVYSGEWKWNLRHGKGTLSWANGTVYTGDFADGERTGQGTLTWADGTVYTGSFENGKRSGYGTLTNPNGTVYTGMFANDTRHGQGTLQWSSGTVYTGEFVDGEATGYGTIVWKSGNSYVGEVQNGQPHGKGTMTWANGSTRSGTWKDGQFVQ